MFSIYEILGLRCLESLFIKFFEEQDEDLATIFAVRCLDVSRNMVIWEAIAYLPEYKDWKGKQRKEQKS